MIPLFKAVGDIENRLYMYEGLFWVVSYQTAAEETFSLSDGPVVKVDTIGSPEGLIVLRLKKVSRRISIGT